MPAITSTGVGSGLDVNSIVTSLMALEKRPLTLLQTSASSIQTKLSAFGSLKSQLSGLGDIASTLTSATAWNPLRSDSTDSAAISATATSTAVAGKYTMEVEQLAQPQSLASGPYATTGTFVGTGTLTLEIGTTAAGVFTAKSGSTPKPITIDSGNQTLAGIRDAINTAAAGVTASIVTSGGSSRLVLRSADGADSSIRLTATDDDGNNTDAAGLSALAWDPAATVGAGKNLSQTQGAQDAKYTLNGLALTSATNTPAEVVTGVTLNLKKITTAPVDLTVSIETVAVRKNVNDFVNAYNGLNALLKAQTNSDPSGAANGPLQADSTATALLYAMRGMLQGSVTGLSSPDSLSAAGIELQRDGSLKVNDTKLAPLLATPEKLARLFNQAKVGSDVDSRGFGVRFKEWASSFTSATGILSNRTTGLTDRVTRNQKEQDAQQDKLTRTEARLRKQYQTLDTQMSSLNSQLAQMKSALGLT